MGIQVPKADKERKLALVVQALALSGLGRGHGQLKRKRINADMKERGQSSIPGIPKGSM